MITEFQIEEWLLANNSLQGRIRMVGVLQDDDPNVVLFDNKKIMKISRSVMSDMLSEVCDVAIFYDHSSESFTKQEFLLLVTYCEKESSLDDAMDGDPDDQRDLGNNIHLNAENWEITKKPTIKGPYVKILITHKKVKPVEVKIDLVQSKAFVETNGTRVKE